MNYCVQTTMNHKFAITNTNSLKPIMNIVKRDGGKLSNTELVFDLDEIETQIAKKTNRNEINTVDITFGVKNNNEKSLGMLLVELKLRMKNQEQFSKTDFENKVNHSKAIMGQDISIHTKCYFVVNGSLKQKMTNEVRRKYNNNPNINCIVIDEQELNNIFA